MGRLAILFCVCFLAVAASAQEPPEPTLAWFGDKAAVPVYVSGVGPYTFLLDTTAAQPVLDKSLAAPLGGSAESARAPLLHAGPFAHTKVDCAVADLSPLQARFGVPIFGLLPARLGSEPLLVDFPGSAFSYGEVPEGYRRFSTPMQMENQGTRISVLLNGRHLRPAVLDSTYGGTLGIPMDQADDLALLPENTPKLEVEQPEDEDLGLDGSVQVRLRSMAIGGAEMLDPLCTLLEEGDRIVVGMGFLRHFRAAFDYAGQRLYLSPAGEVPLRGAPIDGYGVTLAGPREGLWVVLVAVNGPAYRSGVRSGDRLAAVDGQSLAGVSYADASALLAAAPGRTAKLTILRGAETREVSLTAERIF